MSFLLLSIFTLLSTASPMSAAWADAIEPFLCHTQLYRQGGVPLTESLMYCREKPDRSVLDCQNEFFLSFGFSIRDALSVCKQRSDEPFVNCVREKTLVQYRPQLQSAYECMSAIPPSSRPYKADFDSKKIYPTYPKLDPSKLTVCSITVNSDNEIRAFKKVLEPQGVQFVELAPRLESVKGYPIVHKDWLLQACKQGIRCDSLVVSGHFAGQFIGDNIPFELQLNDLTSYSCMQECGGLLKAPKEVYLFGCNTLATNSADARTPELYVEILMGHALTRNQAEMQSARRYLGAGLMIEEQIRASFPSVPKVYGFPSVSPLGKNIESAIVTYLRKLGNYQKHLEGIARGKSNPMASRILGDYGMIQVSGDAEENETLCRLTDQIQDPSIILPLVEKLAREDRSLREILLAHWMGARIKEMPPMEEGARERAYRDVIDGWERLSTMPSVAFRVLDLAVDMKVMSLAEAIQLKSTWISRLVEANHPMKSLEAICDLSDNHDLSTLMLSERAKAILTRVPADRQKLLLGCLSPYSKE